ncbi:MAG TPA: hypothetical protein VFJ91_11075 [Gaiellaceae bacterium]|nr:hypothetical protein [Gaiellaceae bacterium]
MVLPQSFDPAAEAWLAGLVAPAGPPVLESAMPWASVWRIPLAGGGAAWFKSCAPAQAFEPRLTAALASRRPDVLPEVLGWDEGRSWLLLADAGTPLGIGGGPAPWPPVLAAYAELQRGETAHAAAHLAAGVPDRGLARFPELHERLLAAIPGLVPREDVPALAVELAAAGIAETIQHDDLHGNNVYGRRILDWGDSCVSHPFLTFFVTVAHLADGTPEERLRDAYLEPWGDADARDAFAVARRLGPYAHAFKELETLGEVPDWVRRLL